MAQYSVVIVDSHDIVRFALETLIAASPDLQLAGSAETLAAGLALIRRTTPDLVITDMNLRDSSGLDTVREVVAAQAPRRTLVVAANDEKLFGEPVLLLGAGGYLMKDSAQACVVPAALAVAAGERWTSPALARHLVNRAVQSRRAGADASSLPLTLREMDVLEHLKNGKSTKQIAAAMNISPRTVDLYRASIKKKLRLRTAAELIAFASRHF